jgi:hypothetical protein
MPSDADDSVARVREVFDVRVTGADGTVVASVMSTLGSYRHLISEAADIIVAYGDDVNDAVLRTGDLRPVQAPWPGYPPRTGHRLATRRPWPG